jgi:dihydropteroate synthase
MLVMGILNVTPDSFSDGGLYLHHDAAVEHGLEMVRDGADLVDVGGESTRPGAAPVDAAEESRRVLEVVRDLVAEGVKVSIDTRHAVIAQACVEAGAVLVNDVSAGRGDELMWPVVAELSVPYVVMHNRGSGSSRDDLARYDDVRRDVARELGERVTEAERAGIERARLVVDPGIGFAKRAEHNWPLVDAEGLSSLVAAVGMAERPPLPVLLGVSRKRFLATRPDGSARQDDHMHSRDELTTAITRTAAMAGVWCVRVHDVAGSAGVVAEVRSEHEQ